MLSVGFLIDELRYTSRGIITNFALKLHPWIDAKGKPRKGLLRVMAELFGEDYNAVNRIYFLPQDSITRFFGVRLRVSDDPSEPTAVEMVPISPDKLWHFDGKLWKGACYFIDEAHEYFKQADWQLIGSETQSWASQNRRTGDDAWLLTQDAELVAKPFRRQSLECYYVTNRGHMSFGPFRQPNVISYGLYMSTPPKPMEPALRHGRLTYSRDILQEVYDTAGGAGVHGGSADIGFRAKGLHWSWIIAFFVIGFCAICLGLYGCNKATNAAVSSAFSGSAKSNAVSLFPVAISNLSAVHNDSTPASPNRFLAVRDRVRDGQSVLPKVSGWTQGTQGYAVAFSDGVIVLAKSFVEEGRFVFVDGVRYERGPQNPAGIPLRDFDSAASFTPPSKKKN